MKGELFIDDLLRQGLVAGDARAFDELYHLFAERIFSTVMRYTNDQHLAEDVVQQVFLSCWEKRENFTDIRSLNDFLFIVSRNRIYDELKKLSNQQKLLHKYKLYAETETSDVEDRVQTRQYEELMQAAISQLSPQQQRIYELRQQQSLSYEAIAEQLQISKFTVKRHLEMARKTIREYLQLHLPKELLVTGCILTIFGIN